MISVLQRSRIDCVQLIMLLRDYLGKPSPGFQSVETLLLYFTGQTGLKSGMEQRSSTVS